MGKGLTITAFVLSLLVFVPLAPIVGLVLGIIAFKRAENDPTALRGLAIAAIVIGAVFSLINIITTAGFIAGFLKAVF